MKRLSKKLSILLALAIMLTGVFGMPIAAAGDVAESDEIPSVDIVEQEFGESIDVIVLPEQPDEVVTLSGDNKGSSTARSANIIGKKLNIDDAEEVPLTTTRQLDGDTVNGVITVPNTAVYYAIDLPGGFYLQAQVDLPNNANLDYDLYLLNSNFYIIDYAAYRTNINGNSGTLSEAVGYITSGATSTYYIYIESYAGASMNEFFTLHYAISGQADPWEEDENVKWAWPITFNFGGTTITGRDLNSFIDNDLFVFTVPTNAPYHALSLSINTLSNNAHAFELYTNVGASGTYKMAKQTISGGSVNVTKGQTYYLRVYTPETAISFDANSILSYNLVISPKLTPTNLVITDINGPSKAWINSYGGGYRWRFGTGLLTVDGQLTALINGSYYAVPSTNVTIHYYNPHWDANNTPAFANVYANGNTNSIGEFSIGLQMPPGLGAYTYYNGSLSIHYWDNAGIAAYATNYTNAYDSLTIYHLALSVLQ